MSSSEGRHDGQSGRIHVVIECPPAQRVHVPYRCGRSGPAARRLAAGLTHQLRQVHADCVGGSRSAMTAARSSGVAELVRGGPARPAGRPASPPPGRPGAGLVHVVGGQQDGGAALAQPAHQLPRVVAGGRVEAGRRLVQEQQLRGADQAQRQVQPPALPARERLDPGVALARPARPARSPRRDRGPAGSSGPAAATSSRTVNSSSKPALCSTTPMRSAVLPPARRRVVAKHPDLAARCAAGARSGSPPWSSCRRRSGRAARTPRPRSR